MENKKSAKRAALKERLTDAAEGLIAENGLRGLKARDIAARAQCALGGLYTAVDGLDQLILLVNSRTLNRLGQASLAAVPAQTSPGERMHILGQVYARFALENVNLWSALFAHRLPDGQETPEWLRAEFAALIQQIVAPLSELRPDLDGQALQQRAKTLFAAVHGVVHMSIHGFDVGAPPKQLSSEIEALINAMMGGINTSA